MIFIPGVGRFEKSRPIRKRKVPSYRKAVEWIALNDDSGSSDAHNPEVVESLISVVLVADLFDVPQFNVALDVVKFRMKGK